jgi:Ca2+-dependent lipid-binding protein
MNSMFKHSPFICHSGETPDPYVMLRVRSSPNAKQQTTTKGDDVNPVWNETFKFYLNPDKKNMLGMIVK